MKKIKQRIAEVEKWLEWADVKKRQEFISFRKREFEAVIEASRLMEKSKARTIAIACGLLLESLKGDE